jgi:hypothetical protein
MMGRMMRKNLIEVVARIDELGLANRDLDSLIRRT